MIKTMMEVGIRSNTGFLLLFFILNNLPSVSIALLIFALWHKGSYVTFQASVFPCVNVISNTDTVGMIKIIKQYSTWYSSSSPR